MDQSKKQNLTPELKQIYDRVMNTHVESKPSTPATTTSPAPANTSPAQPATPPPAATAAPAATTPEAPKSDAKPSVTTSPTPPATGIGTNKTFVFNGNNKVTTPVTGGTVQAPTGGKKISGAVIAGLVVVLLAVWGLFWAKILGVF